MTIVNMKKFKIALPGGGSKQHIGFAIMNDSGKFLSLDGKKIYMPCGGRKVLKELLPIADTFKFITLK